MAAMDPIDTAMATVPHTSARASFRSVSVRDANHEPATAPSPHNVVSSPYPTDPAWKCSVSGRSATKVTPKAAKVQAVVATRRTSTRWRATVTKPSRAPPVRTPGAFAENRPRTAASTTAETTNDTAFTANTQRAPTAATTAPPTRGPTTSEALNAVASMPLAHDKSSASTRLGMAAADAARNGALAAVASRARTTSAPGDRANSTATQPAAAASSAM